ncbi:hypothetical protein LEMLEM_LOCUS12272 [Lemmus lemmus]
MHLAADLPFSVNAPSSSLARHQVEQCHLRSPVFPVLPPPARACVLEWAISLERWSEWRRFD